MVQLEIPQESGDPLIVTVADGERLYVVGANGTGKSALVQQFVSSLSDEEFRRLPAHRQLWFNPNSSNSITPSARRELASNIRRRDLRFNSVWQDQLGDSKHALALFDLLQQENYAMRTIGRHFYTGETEEAQRVNDETQSPLDQINELLLIAGMSVHLEIDRSGELIAKHNENGVLIGVERLSDGERNAVIVAANVLTVDPGTVLLIDEPERHLHRSIIEPLLSALFALRKDCPFIISTHELALPIADSDANVLSISSCAWEGDLPKYWHCKLLDPAVRLPEDVKRAILGSRRQILFVEGEDSRSLDLPLYSALFPGISIMPRHSCGMVEDTVRGLRATYDQHEVEAFGLIDRDDRSELQVENLAVEYIFALAPIHRNSGCQGSAEA